MNAFCFARRFIFYHKLPETRNKTLVCRAIYDGHFYYLTFGGKNEFTNYYYGQRQVADAERIQSGR